MLDGRLNRLGRKGDSCCRRGIGSGRGVALASPGLWGRGRGRLRGRLLWGLLHLLGLDGGGLLRMLDVVLLLDMLGLDVLGLLLVRLRLGLLLDVLGVLLRMLVHVLRLHVLGVLGMLGVLLLLARVLRHRHRGLDGALVLLLLMVLLGWGRLGMWGGTVGAVVRGLVAAIQILLGILVLLSAVPGTVSKGRLLLRLHRVQRGWGLRP